MSELWHTYSPTTRKRLQELRESARLRMHPLSFPLATKRNTVGGTLQIWDDAISFETEETSNERDRTPFRHALRGYDAEHLPTDRRVFVYCPLTSRLGLEWPEAHSRFVRPHGFE